MRIRQSSWPEALVKACYHAYTLQLYTACEEDFIDPFVARWGGYTLDILERVLQEGRDDEKIFSLFALGYFAFPESPQLLFPFLTSEKHMERWASLIALGCLKDERVFPLLQKQLLEGLQDDDWQREEYEWCLLLRVVIIDILETWGNSQAVPVLRQALRVAWEVEQREPHEYFDVLHHLQDHLAHALGRLGAWEALSGLNLSPAHLRIARIYMVLGALEINSWKIYGNFAYQLFQYPDLFSEGMLLWNEGRTPLPRSYRLKRFLRGYGKSHGLSRAELEVYVQCTNEVQGDEPGPYEDAPLYLNPIPIMQILESRFGLSEEEQGEHPDLYLWFTAALRQRHNMWLTSVNLDELDARPF